MNQRIGQSLTPRTSHPVGRHTLRLRATALLASAMAAGALTMVTTGAISGAGHDIAHVFGVNLADGGVVNSRNVVILADGGVINSRN